MGYITRNSSRLTLHPPDTPFELGTMIVLSAHKYLWYAGGIRIAGKTSHIGG
jgi:hypothetical protein